MKQPNTHHLRRFIDRAAVVSVGGSIAFTKKEMEDISLGMTDLLLYQRELEQEVKELKAKLESAETLSVEMIGDRF